KNPPHSERVLPLLGRAARGHAKQRPRGAKATEACPSRYPAHHLKGIHQVNLQALSKRQFAIAEQADRLQEILLGSTCFVERDEYPPRFFHLSPPFREHGLDVVFFSGKINHAGGINDSLVTRRRKRHGLSISVDECNPPAKLRLSDHLRTQINAITLVSMLPQLRDD